MVVPGVVTAIILQNHMIFRTGSMRVSCAKSKILWWIDCAVTVGGELFLIVSLTAKCSAAEIGVK